MWSLLVRVHEAEKRSGERNRNETWHTVTTDARITEEVDAHAMQTSLVARTSIVFFVMLPALSL